jgi:hypothetical protein
MNKLIITKKELQNLIEGYTATAHLQQMGMITNSYHIEVEDENNKRH